MFRQLSLALLATTALVPATAFAQELPTGGEVQAGVVAIQTTAPGTMKITQGSDRAIVNWRGFSVGEGGRVDIAQPDASSALLNRVTGDTTSVIAGQVNANGRVYLVNPNGILITRTGSVSAAAFTASTLDIADRDFMAGSDDLTVTAPRLVAPIRYLEGGFAGALSDDSGTLFVLARVRDVLGTSERALDLGGDGFLQVAVKPGTIEVAGRVTADQIVLTTSAARAAARGVVNVSGVLDASSVSARGGTITLTGDSVNLTAATLDASGALGGGRVRVGLATGAGPARGEGAPTRTAEFVSVDAATRIAADATGAGSGGNVVVWSDAGTSFAGAVSARGVGGGAGGDAEVSGKALLDFTGTADLTGARFGTLLLDPYDVAITAGAQTTGAGFTATGNNSVINATTLKNALATANVTVSTGSGGTQNGDIFVNSAVGWSSGSQLTLSAAGRLVVNAPISVNGGGQVALNFTTTNASDYTQGLSFAPGASVVFADAQTGQALAINGTSYTLLRSMADVDGIDGVAASANAINAGVAGDSGFYALAKNLDAAGTTYTTALFGHDRSFSGTFEGLGHVIANLAVNAQTTGSFDARGPALIQQTDTTGVVRDLGLTGINILLGSEGFQAAALVNINSGTINQAYASGTVRAAGDPGTLATVGGLVAVNNGKIYLSFSTVDVSATQAQYIGGLVGSLGSKAIVARSYATGSVTTGSGIVGGLVGFMAAGIAGTPTTVVDSYATGAVTTTSSSQLQIGGLIGSLNNYGYVANSYATGAITAPSGAGGGLIGFFRTNDATNVARNPVISNLYWDTQSSGRGNGIGTVGPNGPLPNNYSGTGLTTAQLQSGDLPGGFDPAVWVTAAGFYPQLTPPYSTGFANAAMQVVSGIAYQSAGGAIATNASVGLYNNGSLLSGNKVTTDASGAYKALVPAQTLSGTFALGQTITLSGASAVSGATYDDTLTTNAASNVSGLTIASGVSTFRTSTTSYSALSASVATTFGDANNGLQFSLASTPLEIAAKNAFALDQAVSVGSSFKLTAGYQVAVNAAITAGGLVRITSFDSLTIGQGGSVTSYASGDAILLAANGDNSGYYGTFGNAGGAAALSTPNGRWIVYQASGTTGDRGGLTGKSLYGDAYNFTTGAFTATPGAGNRFVYAGQSTLTVTAANVTSAYTGAVQTDSYSVSGLINGDTTTDAVSGTATGLTTLSKNVGSYTLTPAGLVSPIGYLLNYQPGTFVIGAGTLLYTANPLSRAYGDANPALTGTVTGFVGGDTQANSTAGTPTFSTAATSTTGVNSYAVNGSGLTATNYVFSQAAGNATALTITARPITVAADAATRVYGDANPAFTYQVGGRGLVGTDTLSGGLTTAASAISNVGSFAITQGSLTGGANYAISYTGANLSVAARPITITADAKTRVYGDANPAFTYVTGGRGLVNGDTLTGALTTTADTTTGIGAYAITQGSLAASPNYALAYTAANLGITVRPITVTADAQTRVYGDANSLLTYQVGGRGLVNGDTLAGALATTATTTSNVGSYVITQGSLAASPNYQLSFTGNQLAVTTRPIAVAADALSRVYGDANSALTYTVGGRGLVNGDVLTGTLATGAAVTSGIGAYAITQGTLAATTNYQLTYQGANLTVTTRPITVGADALSRVYGDANPALTYTVGGRGLANGDMLSGGLTTGAVATSGIGQYAIVQGTLAASANYALTYSGANLSVTVRPITVAADALSRVYGDANPALTYTVGGRGLVNGDGLTGALATAAMGTSGIGTYAITQGSVAASANYALTFAGATLTVTVRPITVTADALSRLYGDANPALTYTVGGRGLVNSDSLSGALATAATVTSNVGPYSIAQGSLAATANYALTYTGANLTVTPATLTYTADAKTRVYGDANPALTGMVTGFRNADTQATGTTGTLAFGTTAAMTSGIGAYAINGSGLSATNYIFVQGAGNSTALSVTARPITIAADAQSRVYGDANPALSYQIGGRGLVNGDGLTGGLATAASATTGIGQSAITQGTLAAGANYALTYVGANLTVTARPVSIAADALSRVYGDANPAFSYTVGGRGLVNGDTLTGALATNATTASSVGGYAITQGSLAASANYALTYSGANLSVTVRPITVAADALSRVYGDANPALTYTVGGRGLVNGDTLSGALTTGATTASGVGQYAIAQGTLAASANYALTYQGATLSIAARPITVAADAQSRVYGDANPALTYAVGGRGLINGDTLTGGLTTGATVTSGVGGYGIAQGTLAATANYALTYAAATLAITARPLTVTADPLGRTYGDPNPTLTFTLSGRGLVNGDQLSGALATGAGASSNVGQYAMGQGTLTAGSNYALTYQGANLTVTTRAITVAADAQSRVYGDANPALTYAVGGRGLANGDTLSGAMATSAVATTGIGQYAITQGSLAASANYTLTYAGANLTVTARPISVAADALSRLYGDTNPALTYTVGGRGLVNGDTLAGGLATAATQASNVGQYAIEQGTLGAGANYALAFTGANLAVTPATLTYAADAKTRVYGDASPMLTGSVTGFRNADAQATTTTGTLAFSTAAAMTSGVGSYAISGSGLSATNYIFVQAAGNATALTIVARPISVTADALARIYGDANPALTYSLGGRGLVNGDTLTGALATGAGASSNVGQYAIAQGTLMASGNYALTYTGANLSVTVRPITVAADALSRVYGDANPALTYTLGGRGLANGDALTGALTTGASATSAVGQFTILQGTLAATTNYALTFQGANLSVTARPITIAADAQSRVYGDANPALTYRLGGRGLVNGDVVSGALATSATTASGTGQYAIDQGTLAATPNYKVTYTGASLTVTPRQLSIIADALSRVYGDANPTLSYTVGGRGLVNGDTLTGVQTTVATTASDPGRYAIGQGSLMASVNYAVSYTGSTLTITPKLTGLAARIERGAAAGNVARDHGFLFAVRDLAATVRAPTLQFCPAEGGCVPAGR